MLQRCCSLWLPSPAPLTFPCPTGCSTRRPSFATFPDQFEPWAEADDDDPALLVGGQTLAYGELMEWAGTLGADARAHLATDDPAVFLGTLLRAWASGGSVVLTRGEPSEESLAERLATERVTHPL